MKTKDNFNYKLFFAIFSLIFILLAFVYIKANSINANYKYYFKKINSNEITKITLLCEDKEYVFDKNNILFYQIIKLYNQSQRPYRPIEDPKSTVLLIFTYHNGNKLILYSDFVEQYFYVKDNSKEGIIYNKRLSDFIKGFIKSNVTTHTN
ncbi:hypothetical protein [Carboxydothermus pertinax]|uniref:Uncharacterized protein n=1 Tax=Carboxydothermus pertinax TaxID=870242 RepID=A0A1L8CY74_9THEO|nr:hypothetical protein [Carboxydothermus pertinax]GAV23878.1 hypothetical protein cpu_23880 [Carboxydothermus pertinax]